MGVRLAALGAQKGLAASRENAHLLLVKTVTLAVAHSDGKKMPLPSLPAQQANRQAPAGLPAVNDKTDARKKTNVSHAAATLPTGLTSVGSAPLQGGVKIADAKKPEPAAPATAPAADAKTVAAHHAEQVVRVVDQRSKPKTEEARTTQPGGPSAPAPELPTGT